MLYLCFDSTNNVLSIEDRHLPKLNVLISPFEISSNSGKREQSYEVVVPNSNFKIHLIARYNSHTSEMIISDNGKDFYHLSSIIHKNSMTVYDTDLRKVHINLKGESDDIGWRKCYNIIIDLYNKRTTWQVNETLSMMKDMKALFYEDTAFNSMRNNSSVKHEGLDLHILKANKLKQCIQMLQKNDMLKLSSVMDDIVKMCIECLPMLKKVYLIDLANIKQIQMEYNEAEKLYEQYTNAKAHLQEYEQFMLYNKHSSTSEHATYRFKMKFPSEYKLIETISDIQKNLNEKSLAWNQIVHKRTTIEECYKCIFDFMYNEGLFSKFLSIDNK